MREANLHRHVQAEPPHPIRPAVITPLTDPAAPALLAKFLRGQIAEGDLPTLELPPHLQRSPFRGLASQLLASLNAKRQPQQVCSTAVPSEAAPGCPAANHAGVPHNGAVHQPSSQSTLVAPQQPYMAVNAHSAQDAARVVVSIPEAGAPAADVASAPPVQGSAPPPGMPPVFLLASVPPTAFQPAAAPWPAAPPAAVPPAGPDAAAAAQMGSGVQQGPQQQPYLPQQQPQQQPQQPLQQPQPHLHHEHGFMRQQLQQEPQQTCLPMDTLRYQQQQMQQILQQGMQHQQPLPRQPTQELFKLQQSLLQLQQLQQAQQQAQALATQATMDQQPQQQFCQGLPAMPQQQAQAPPPVPPAPVPPPLHLAQPPQHPAQTLRATACVQQRQQQQQQQQEQVLSPPVFLAPPHQHSQPQAQALPQPHTVNPQPHQPRATSGVAVAGLQPPSLLPTTAAGQQPQTAFMAAPGPNSAPPLGGGQAQAPVPDGSHAPCQHGVPVAAAAAAPAAAASAEVAAALASCLQPCRPLGPQHKLARVRAVLAMEMSHAWDELCAAPGAGGAFAAVAAAGAPTPAQRAQLLLFGRTQAQLDDAFKERFPPYPPGRMEYTSVTTMYDSVGAGIAFRGLRSRPDGLGADTVFAPCPSWGRDGVAVMAALLNQLRPLEEQARQQLADAEHERERAARRQGHTLTRERSREGLGAGHGLFEGQQGGTGLVGPRGPEEGAREGGAGVRRLAGSLSAPPPWSWSGRKRPAEGTPEGEQAFPGSRPIHPQPPVPELRNLRMYLRIALAPQLRSKDAKPLPLGKMLEGFRATNKFDLTPEMVASAGFASVEQLLREGFCDLVKVVRLPEPEPGGEKVVLVPVDAYRNEGQVALRGLHRQPRQPAGPQELNGRLQSHGSGSGGGSGAAEGQGQGQGQGQARPLAPLGTPPLLQQQQQQQQQQEQQHQQQQLQQQQPPPPQQQQQQCQGHGQGQAVQTGLPGGSGTAETARGLQHPQQQLPMRVGPHPAQAQAQAQLSGERLSDSTVVPTAAAIPAASVQVSEHSGGGGGGGSSASASAGSSAGGLTLSRGAGGGAASRRRQAALPAHLRPKPPRPPEAEPQQTGPHMVSAVVGSAGPAGPGPSVKTEGSCAAAAAATSAPPGSAPGALPMPPIVPAPTVAPQPLPPLPPQAASAAAAVAPTPLDVSRVSGAGVTIQLEMWAVQQAVTLGAGACLPAAAAAAPSCWRGLLYRDNQPKPLVCHWAMSQEEVLLLLQQDVNLVTKTAQPQPQPEPQPQR